MISIPPFRKTFIFIRRDNLFISLTVRPVEFFLRNHIWRSCMTYATTRILEMHFGPFYIKIIKIKIRGKYETK